ncbi:MAG: hypothetical protein K9N06_01585 [Candidatus Cloacimonetes bacterium]|nr:hypothetical protein [Candidatus Cloacimonadota bacterium]
MKKTWKFWYWLSLLLLLVIGSCAVRYLPVGSPGAQIINDAYLYRDSDTELVAQCRYWSREPQNLNDYFTTFYVSVKNNKEQKLQVAKTDFALLDQNGNQFDPLTVEQIEDILLHNELQYLVIKNVEEKEVDRLVTLNDQTNILEEWRRAKRNLLSDSFGFGEIYPNAKRSGYIFFPKAKVSNDELTLIYKDKLLKFRR